MRNLKIFVTNGRVHIPSHPAPAGGQASIPRILFAVQSSTQPGDPDSQSGPSGGRETSPEPCLTPRETQVLKFVAEGLTNRQSAREMNVSVKTVEKHRQSVMNKLHLHDTAALTRYAVGRGITFENKFGLALARRLKGGSGWCARTIAKSEPAAAITSRETEVLKLIADGLANKQIASALNISVKTVGNHRLELMKRLNIHEVASLTRYAISKGLIALGIRRQTAACPLNGPAPHWVCVERLCG